MPPNVAIIVPVLDRPDRAETLLGSVETTHPSATVVFVASPQDKREIRELDRLGVTYLTSTWPAAAGDYAKKINLGFRSVTHESLDEARADWVFLGADDLRFHPGWFDACMRRHSATGACVIGTNDLGNDRTSRGIHSTHSLVHRDYLECGTIDQAGVILHEGYDHQYVDDEFVQTAIWRGTYAHASDAIVEHFHPDWGKAPEDATYAKGRRGLDHDRDLYRRRKRQWGKE